MNNAIRGRRRLALLICMLCAWAPLAPALEVAGTLAWAGRVGLGTPVSGVVSEVAARVGQRVSRGQALVTLDPRPFAAAVEGARARVDGALPALEEARRELGRAQELYDRTVLSDHELQLARIAVARADADHRAAQAALRQAQLDREYSTLHAPFDALVLRVDGAPGQTVVTAERSVELVTVAETGRMRVLATVDPDLARRLELGAEVPLVADGRALSGRLIAVHPETTEGPGSGHRVEVLFPVPDGVRLFPGQGAVLDLPNGQ